MKLVPEKGAVVLKLRKPERLLTAIPSAKRVPLNGGHYVAIPHRVDETRMLNNLGVQTPSPILYHYNWPGLYTPFEAQKQTAAMLTLNSRAYVLNEVGTGKSMGVLWAYDFLRSAGKADILLVVAPLSTLERTWADEIFTHLPHLKFSVVYGTRRQRLRALAADANVFIINHDGVKVVLDALVAMKRITHVAVDELAHVARNQRTEKWKALNTLVNRAVNPRACWGMTGTPTPNEPTDAWAQSRLVTPENAPRSFLKFRDMTMRQYGPYKWLPRDDAMQTVQRILTPAVRYTRDECVDLPECMYETRAVPMTTEQTKAYKAMATKLKAELDAGEILAVNQAVKANKLVQIACGVAYNTDGEEVLIDATPRLAELVNVIEATEHKVIVFVPYVSTINMVSAFVRAAGHTVECIYGEVSKNERDRIFHDFQKTKHPRVLVAQPAAMSHGLTLTSANTIVWYGPVMSNEIYEQANGRITRPGQRNNQYIVHLEGTPIEAHIYRRLKDKQSMQGVLLDAVKKSRLT